MKEFRVEESEEAKGILRTGRILVIAFTLGIFGFGGVVAFLVFSGEFGAQEQGEPIVAYVMGLIGATSLVSSFITPDLVVAKQRKQIDTTDENAGPFAQLYLTRLLMGCSPCEGGAFANLLGGLINLQWWSFAIVGVFLLAILSWFPTEAGMENFVRQQMELGELERGRGE